MRREAGEFQRLGPYSGDEGPAAGRPGERALVRVESGASQARPRDLGEILDLAMELFRARFGLYVGLSTLLWLPVRLVRPLLASEDWFSASSTSPPVGLLLVLATSILAAVVVAVFDNALVARLVAGELEGRRVPVGAAFRAVLSRSLSVAAIALVNGVLSVAGFLCFCVPGILVAWKVYLAPAICVIEDVGVGESITRSFDLSRHRFLGWAGQFLVAFLLLLPFTTVAGIADNPQARSAAIAQLGISGLAFDWIAVGFTSLFTGVATAFQGVLVTVWYFDCRARREGTDLAARLDRRRSATNVSGAPS